MRFSRYKIGGTAVGLIGVVTVAACGGGGGSQSTQLATQQILNFPAFQSPGTWDPGEADAEVDTEFSQNVLDNLWKFDHNLNVAANLAMTVPSQGNGGISSDGTTYTVHLNPNAKFANGDPLTSKDVLYSWNRAADLQGPYSSIMSQIVGFKAVQTAAGAPPGSSGGSSSSATTFQQNIENQLAAGNKAFMMTGLTAPDAHTVQIKLAAPCGWCLAAWTLQGATGAIIDEKDVKPDPVNWWSHPCTNGSFASPCLFGTGPYYLTQLNNKQNMQFKSVSNWWGSPKPTVTEVDVDIKDPSAVPTTVTAWEQNRYDLIGYGGDSSLIKYPQIQAVKANSRYASQYLSVPKGRTTWVSFNVGYPSTGGPFVGESAAAKGLRMAFALAVNKQGLASTVCHNVLCQAATNGLITKGLIGSGADNSDPLAAFDASKAKLLLHQFDPNGTKTGNLKYSYNTGGLNDDVATYLQSQWQTNLGVHVSLDPSTDASQFISNRLSGKYVMSRDGWQFDYNHPQDWYDNLWGTYATAAGANTSGFDDPTYDSILKQADTLPLSQSLSMYNQLGKILQDDVVYIPLYYSVGNFLIHSYVKGAGSNTQADYYWNGIQILSH